MDLELLTWNTDGLDDRHLDLRAEALCLEVLLRPRHPHVVLLQEVVPRTFHAHYKSHFGHAGYRCFPPDPPDSNYFELVLVRAPLAFEGGERWPFPSSQMGRALTVVTARVGTVPLTLLTGHLESLKEGSHERRNQVTEVARRIRAAPGLALFGGDTNLRDPETLGLLDGVQDAWEMAGSPSSSRQTWDPRINPNIRTRGGKPRPLRFDRVLLDARAGWGVKAFELLGKSPIEEAGGLWPSDHQGVLVSLTMADATAG